MSSPLTSLLQLDRQELESIVSNPEAVVKFLDKGISWDCIVNTHPEIRIKMYQHFEVVINFHENNIKWDQLIALPSEMRDFILSSSVLILRLPELGVKWEEIIGTDLQILKELFASVLTKSKGMICRSELFIPGFERSLTHSISWSDLTSPENWKDIYFGLESCALPWSICIDRIVQQESRKKDPIAYAIYEK